MDRDRLRSALVNQVQEILPHLSEDIAHDLVDHVMSQGVKKERDLRRITIIQLKEKLDHVDSADLFEEWQNQYAGNAQPSTSKEPPAASGPSSSCSSQPGPSRPPLSENLQAQSRKVLMPEMPVFEKDSPYLPAGVQDAIVKKKRPTNREREMMVDRIVDHCRAKVPNLQRIMLNTVAKQLVSFYPDSFKDTIPISDHGSDSLAKQMRDKLDNDKRARINFPLEKEAPSVKQSYGCISWNPELPENETEESQEKHRLTLTEIHKRSKKQWDWKVVHSLMDKSHYWQRKDINGTLVEEAVSRRKRKRSIEDEDEPVIMKTVEIKTRWPFLFHSKGMNYHFINLTGIDFKDKLDHFIREKSDNLIDFLGSKNEALAVIRRKMIRAERAGHGNTKLIGMLHLLIQYFGEKEKEKALVRFVEKTTSFDEVSSVADFPADAKPVIFAAGTTLYDAERFFFSVDNTVVSSADNILESFSLLFCAYFVLNIEYSNDLSATLTFTQRIIAGINQVNGAKCGNAQLTKQANAKVLKLSNTFALYEQKLDNEADEEN